MTAAPHDVSDIQDETVVKLVLDFLTVPNCICQKPPDKA